MEEILVTPQSATRGLYASGSMSIFPINENHSDMVKFREGDPNCQVVLGKLREICQHQTSDASDLPKSREPTSTGGPERHWMIPFGRNREFVGRESILEELLERIPPDADQDDCQRTVVEGLGGVGKTQIALEAAFRVRDNLPDCSVFWVSAVDAISFENAYREIGRALEVKGIDEDNTDVKALVQTALGRTTGCWLLIVDNADNAELFGSKQLSYYLPFNQKGSILLTTRNHDITLRLDVPKRNVIRTAEMTRPEGLAMLRNSLEERQIRDAQSTDDLLDFLADLPLAIKQASAYMDKTGSTAAQYLAYCRSSDNNTIDLLSAEFEDRNRYENIRNPVATAWLISFEHISRDNPLAAQYLRFHMFPCRESHPEVSAGDERRPMRQ